MVSLNFPKIFCLLAYFLSFKKNFLNVSSSSTKKSQAENLYAYANDLKKKRILTKIFLSLLRREQKIISKKWV